MVRRKSLPRSSSRPKNVRRRALPRVVPEPLRATALRDATEDLGDMFDEVMHHLLATDDGSAWSVGPVLPLPAPRLSSGSLGWSSSVHRAEGSKNAAVGGTVYLVVVPASPRPVRRPPKELPLVGRVWTEFASVDLFAGPPRLLLLGEAASPAGAGAMREFTHQLFELLTEELR